MQNVNIINYKHWCHSKHRLSKNRETNKNELNFSIKMMLVILDKYLRFPFQFSVSIKQNFSFENISYIKS